MKREKVDRLQELKALAGKQQYLLHDQIETFLDESASVDEMDEVYISLNDWKVDIFDTHEEAQQKLRIKRREEKRPPEKQQVAPSVRYDDPVRMYLREMGRVPLLDREGEVEIAKRIKAGERQICNALFRSPPILKDILALGTKVKQNKVRVEDFTQIDFGNWNPEFSPKKERARVLKSLDKVRSAYSKFAKHQEKSVGRLSEEKRRAHQEKLRSLDEDLLRELAELNLNNRLIDRMAERVKEASHFIDECENEFTEMEQKWGKTGDEIAALARRAKKSKREATQVKREAHLDEDDFDAYDRATKNARKHVRKVEEEANMSRDEIKEV
ncbi:MAG TPA: sigma-70 factor domain-containing protein, partial [Candidatus Eisenbacteria bacterium]|nr:sigma-70 factor domain-containing protein [Candidatus Eisenbacteria bacterium]